MKITEQTEFPKLADIKLDQVIAVKDFVEELNKKYTDQKTSVQSIYYQMEKADNLDWLELSGAKYIYKNEKYENFKPGNNYKRVATLQT